MRVPLFLMVVSLAPLACTARSGDGGLPTPSPDAEAPADVVVAIDDPPPSFDVPVAIDNPAPIDNPVVIDRPVPVDNPVPVDMPRPVDACVAVSESTATLCHDGRDNDCDGLIDCDDGNCAAQCAPDAGRDACVMTGIEGTNATCSDGIDNDCDGYIDCGASGTAPDFGCTMSPTVTVCPRDGGVVVDTGCVPTGRESGSAACTDGRDNDCNGYSDCMDRGCSCTGACAAFRVGCVCGGLENTNARCSNGIDDDCDGFIDCGSAGASADFDCTMTSTVTVCPRDGGAP